MKCNKCGTIQNNGNITSTCQICGTILKSSETIVSIPWEQSDNLGLLNSFSRTAKRILLHPLLFFSQFNNKTNTFMALMFALLATAIGTLGDLLWMHLFKNTSIYSSLNESGITSQTLAYTPIILLASLVLSTSYIFVVTSIFKCRKITFKTLFSGVCYSQAASILSAIPFLGLIIMPFWSLIITTIMISKLNKISILKTLVILLSPMIILFILVVFPLMIFMGGVLFSIGSIIKYYQ